jgi:hypothetical protein
VLKCRRKNRVQRDRTFRHPTTSYALCIYLEIQGVRGLRKHSLIGIDTNQIGCDFQKNFASSRTSMPLAASLEIRAAGGEAVDVGEQKSGNYKGHVDHHLPEQDLINL